MIGRVDLLVAAAATRALEPIVSGPVWRPARAEPAERAEGPAASGQIGRPPALRSRRSALDERWRGSRPDGG